MQTRGRSNRREVLPHRFSQLAEAVNLGEPAEVPATTGFTGVTIVLPVVDETLSLESTVDILLAESRPDIAEILVVDCERTSPHARAVIERLANRSPELIVVHHQTMPFLGGAVREAFELAKGSHVIMMASDLETNPHDCVRLIAASRLAPNAIVTASRWRPGGSFSGYSRVKLVANWVFQRMFSLLYHVPLTDMTYGFRLFPTALVQTIEWNEVRHPFLFETLVKPLRLGIEVLEIPSTWTARTEGASSNSFLRNFEYFRTGVRVRFAAPTTLLRPEIGRSRRSITRVLTPSGTGAEVGPI